MTITINFTEKNSYITDQAYMEYLADPVTYTMDEVLDELGLTREDIA